jgi:predicted amidophosphoribosyltransferase
MKGRPKMTRIGRSSFDLDDIAELAAMLCGAPIAVVLRREVNSNQISTLARYGFINDFHNNPGSTSLMKPGEKIVIYRDVQNTPSLKGHQIQTHIPVVNTLIAVRLTALVSQVKIILGVHNAPQTFFDDDREFGRFVKFVMMLQGQFEDVKDDDLVEAFHPSLPNHEEADKLSVHEALTQPTMAMDPAAKFLFETLSHKQSLHVRNGSSYISLRTWKKQIKEHQIAALSAAKMFPPPSFIEQIADELANNAIRLYGTNSLTAVVPVPGGSSETEQSLSEKLAIIVAKKLKLPCQFVLKPQLVAKGKSHPSKSAKLKPYELQLPVQGTVLLIDDVATSGRHIELAQSAIRSSGQDCFALCWIGP